MDIVQRSLTTKLLWQTAEVFSRRLDNSLGAYHGIGLTEFMVLEALNSAPDQSMRRVDIADALSRTGSGITRLLKPMEKTGLVEKDVNQRDARVSLVKLTTAGAELYNNAAATMDEKSAHLLRNLDATQCQELLDLLNTI